LEEVLDQLGEILPWLVPLIILQLALMVYALVDLIKRDRVRGDNKIVWALIIVFINLIGPIVYLIGGRGESIPSEEVDPDSN
jgi:hypothetical protein